MSERNCKLWFGGVGGPIIQKLRAGDIAKDLRKFGDVGSVEIKQRCVIVTMEKGRDADEVMRESKQRSGRIRICGESFVVDEYRDTTKFGGRDYGDKKGRRADSRERSDGKITSEADYLIKKIQKDRDMCRDLDWRKIEMRLQDLNARLQVKALETYMDSDFKAIRKPMGWFTSIINTLAMGLDHGSRPHDGGFKKSRGSYGDSYRNMTPRSDTASPRTLARRRGGRDDSRSRGRAARRSRSRSFRGGGKGDRAPRRRTSSRTPARPNRSPSRKRSMSPPARRGARSRSGPSRSPSNRRSRSRSRRSGLHGGTGGGGNPSHSANQNNAAGESHDKVDNNPSEQQQQHAGAQNGAAINAGAAVKERRPLLSPERGRSPSGGGGGQDGAESPIPIRNAHGRARTPSPGQHRDAPAKRSADRGPARSRSRSRSRSHRSRRSSSIKNDTGAEQGGPYVSPPRTSSVPPAARLANDDTTTLSPPVRQEPV